MEQAARRESTRQIAIGLRADRRAQREMLGNHSVREPHSHMASSSKTVPKELERGQVAGRAAIASHRLEFAAALAPDGIARSIGQLRRRHSRLGGRSSAAGSCTEGQFSSRLRISSTESLRNSRS
jgi:hypothetical protein